MAALSHGGMRKYCAHAAPAESERGAAALEYEVIFSFRPLRSPTFAAAYVNLINKIAPEICLVQAVITARACGALLI